MEIPFERLITKLLKADPFGYVGVSRRLNANSSPIEIMEKLSKGFIEFHQNQNNFFAHEKG